MQNTTAFETESEELNTPQEMDAPMEFETVESDFINMVDSAIDDPTSHVLGRSVGSAIHDISIQPFLEDLAESASESESALDEQLYSIVRWEVGTITIGEAIAGSQHQAQFGILSSALNSLLLDKEIGFFSIGSFMLQPIQIIESTVHAKNVVLTGHHRLFVNVLLLRKGGAEWEDILKQDIPCFIARIDTEQLQATLELNKNEVAKAVTELEAQLWLSGNASRKSTPTEKSSYKDAKKGVSIYDSDSILTSEVLSSKDKASYYALHLAHREGIFQNPQTGGTERQLQLDPQSTDFKYWENPKINTFSSIISSMLTNLVKTKVFSSDDTAKKKGVSKWQPSIDSRHMPRLIEKLFEIDDRTGTCLIDDAIISGCASAESGWQHNIAKCQALIGKELAIAIDSYVEPLVQPIIRSTQKKEKAPKGANSFKFKGRRVV